MPSLFDITKEYYNLHQKILQKIWPGNYFQVIFFIFKEFFILKRESQKVCMVILHILKVFRPHSLQIS